MKMLAARKKKKIIADKSLSSGEKARQLFQQGENCAQAVLQATCPDVTEEIVAMAEVFGGGIADSKCLCGALNGGAVALSLQGKSDKASRLVAVFQARFKTTCCKGLSAPYPWMSKKHLENCRELTATTADLVQFLLHEETSRAENHACLKSLTLRRKQD